MTSCSGMHLEFCGNHFNSLSLSIPTCKTWMIIPYYIEIRMNSFKVKRKIHEIDEIPEAIQILQWFLKYTVLYVFTDKLVNSWVLW